MPLIQQILLAIRTLTEDEPPQPRRNRHGQTNRQRSNSKRQQAVNLVITFRDLFTSGGLNYLVEDDAVNRRNRHDRDNHLQRRKNNRNIPNRDNSELEYEKQCLVDLTEEEKCLSEDSSIDLIKSENAVAILHEERIISSAGISLPICINISPTSETIREVEVFGRSKKRRKPVTVPLSSDDENKTVAALRKVLKWSPTKQSLATFAVSLPKEDEHKAVAVVQNAVNRVKEEQQKKKKRKFKLFKLTFC